MENIEETTGFNLDNYYTEFGGLSDNGYFSRKKYIQLCDEKLKDKKADFFSKYGKDCYQCVYYYENINNIDHCKIYGDLYFDLDGNIHTKTGYETLKQDVLRIIAFFIGIGLRETDIELYFSGAKGFHVIIPAMILGVIPSTDLNMLYKAWAQYLHTFCLAKSIDLGIYDRKRLLRIPGTTNSKTGLKKERIPIELFRKSSSISGLMFDLVFYNGIYKNIHGYEINEKAAVEFYKRSQNFYKKHTDKKDKQPVHIPEKKEELLPCIKYGLEQGAKVGVRNNTLVVLSSAVLQSGYKLEETLDLMHQWNSNNEKELAFEEIELTVRSAYSMLLSGKRYGCAAIKELGYCVDDKCKIEEKRKINE